MTTNQKKYFDREISGFYSANDALPKSTNLSSWLLTDYPRLRAMVERIRMEHDPNARAEMKRQLPGVTISATFARTRKKENLIQHSGMICLDFDKVPDIAAAKDLLQQLPYIIYAGISASGTGLFAIVPIAYPQYHIEHFRALQQEFETMGLKVDPSCSDVSRLRFYSFDDSPVLNENAEAYRNLIHTPAPAIEKTPIHNNLIDKILTVVEAKQFDLTATYSDWISIAGVLVSELGEAGRPVFHRFSRYYPDYSPTETDRQFNRCLRNRRPMGANLLAFIAKRNGLILKTEINKY